MLYLGGQSGNFQKLSYGSETWHEALSNQDMRIPHPKKNGDPPSPTHDGIFGQTKGGIFKSCLKMFEGDVQ